VYKRIIMLSLGFSARDHFERAAQEAIHKFHRLILVRMFVFLALAMLPALLLGEIWLIGLFTIFLLLAFCLGMNAAILRWTKRRHRLKELLKTHDHHPDFSREVAVLCKRVGVCVIPVYSERSEDDFYVAFFPGLRVIILSFGAEKLLTEQDRLGVFAHEVAHAILPLNILAEFFGNSPIFHAREFAADASYRAGVDSQLKTAKLQHGDKVEIRPELPDFQTGLPCIVPYFKSAINPYGELYSCCLGAQPKEVNGYKLGNVADNIRKGKTNPLETVWKESRDIRLSMLKKVACTSCNFTDRNINLQYTEHSNRKG